MVGKEDRLKVLKFIYESKNTSSERIRGLGYDKEETLDIIRYLETKNLIECRIKTVDDEIHSITPTAKGIDTVEEGLDLVKGSKLSEFKELSDVTFVGTKLKVFISYSDKDKLVAGGIKEALNHFGIEAFLAHEDIPIGEDWVNTIINNLKQADIFFAILSKNFKESNWTDQEVGIAECLSKLVIPISIGGQLPYGFMTKYQAFTFHYTIIKGRGEKEYILCQDEVFNIIPMIAKREEFRENLKDCLITSLKNASSYAEAQNIMGLLMTLGPFSKEQANEIVINSIPNNQVYVANECRRKLLPSFLEEYGSLIKEDNLKKIKALIEE